MDRLKTVIKRQGDEDHGVALFVIHLDRILNALESVGNDAADNVAREVGNRLTALSQPMDSITRLENERWGLLVETQQDKISATTRAQKIQDAFLSPIMIANSNIFVTASIGVAFCEDMNQGAEDMLRNANQAMHHANALGGGRCELFDARIHKQYIAGA